MEYSKIVSVTGLPGLYELINTKSDGAIIRSLDDKTTKFASSRIHNFSHLESIEIFTVGENVNLVDVFQAMEKAGGSLPDTKEEEETVKETEKKKTAKPAQSEKPKPAAKKTTKEKKDEKPKASKAAKHAKKTTKKKKK